MNKWKRSRLEKCDIIFYSDSCMWTVTLQTNRTTWDENRVRTKAAHDSTSATVTSIEHRASLCLRSGLCLCRGWNVRRMWGRNVWGFHLSIGLITCNDACERWCTRISLNLTDSQLNLPFAASKMQPLVTVWKRQYPQNDFTPCDLGKLHTPQWCTPTWLQCCASRTKWSSPSFSVWQAHSDV